MKIGQKGIKQSVGELIVSKINRNGLDKVFKILNGRQKIAFWTDAVSHLNHEINGVNIWLVFIRLIALKIQKKFFFINRLNRL
jgi:hypothetical protein